MTHPSVLNKDKMMEDALEAAHAAIKDLSLRVVEKPSLRDQFAMAALTGMLSNPVTQEITANTIKTAWYVADFMMEARK
jgi:gamma-glutamylcysteine synthetase